MMKKNHPRFNIPNFGTRGRKRVKARWRKQRGIDSKKRIKRSYAGASPEIGYRNPAQLRGVRRGDNARIALVRNMGELRAIAESRPQGAAVTIAKAVSARKRAEMTRLAAQHGVRVTNGVYK